MHNCLIVLSHFGGPTRGRTWDSPVMIRRLCQLSYGFYSLIFQHFRRYSQYFQSSFFIGNLRAWIFCITVMVSALTLYCILKLFRFIMTKMLEF